MQYELINSSSKVYVDNFGLEATEISNLLELLIKVANERQDNKTLVELNSIKNGADYDIRAEVLLKLYMNGTGTAYKGTISGKDISSSNLKTMSLISTNKLFIIFSTSVGSFFSFLFVFFVFFAFCF